MISADGLRCAASSPRKGEHKMAAKQGKRSVERFYVSTFCNFPHRRPDGVPVNHECYILPFIEQEASGDIEGALETLWTKGHGPHSMGIRRRMGS
jgi:hypothetical protein